MTRQLFSVPIFFIVFRETLEAAIIVSVLLGLVEQIVHDDSGKLVTVNSQPDEKFGALSNVVETDVNDDLVRKRRLVRKLRIQVHNPCGALQSLY